MSEEKVVTIRLEDLCTIADAVGAMKHDLDNGKTKYLFAEINRIPAIVEGWAVDEAVLDGADCHDDHRCRLCQEFPVIPKLPVPARRQPAVASSSGHSDSQHSETPERSGTPDTRTSPADITSFRSGVLEMNKKRQYNNGDAEFILEPLSDSVVKVTHRDQTAYFGVSREIGCLQAVHVDQVER